MYEQVEKPKENKSRAVANSVAQKKKNNGEQGFGFVDNRAEVAMQQRSKNYINKGIDKLAIQRRVLPIGTIDTEVEVGKNILAQDLSMDIENYSNVNSMKDSENEVLLGHGTSSGIGGMQPDEMANSLESKMEKEKKYSLTFFACNTGKVVVDGSVATKVKTKLNSDDYKDVTIKAPTKQVFILANKKYLLAGSYPRLKDENQQTLITYEKTIYKESLKLELDKLLVLEENVVTKQEWLTDYNKIKAYKKGTGNSNYLIFRDSLSKIKADDPSKNALEKRIKKIVELASYAKVASPKSEKEIISAIEKDVLNKRNELLIGELDEMSTEEISEAEYLLSGSMGDTTKGWSEG